MKITLRAVLLGIAFVASRLTSHATLVGDTISLSHDFDYIGGLNRGPYSIQVQTGIADTLTVTSADSGGLNWYSVNPESGSILINFLSQQVWVAAGFNGLSITGIDGTVSSVTVVTNIASWDSSRVTFDSHGIYSNWQGLGVDTGSYFNLFLNSDGPTVPDSGHTVLLGGLAFAGLFAFQRRGRKSVR
jgi:hypothetical protein